LPVEIVDGGVGRYGAEVEAAVYFACLEALQNASKHAAGSAVVVSVHESGHDEDDEAGTLVFVVGDEGPGFDANERSAGSGMTNMRDRLTALGGSLEITSAPGSGTRVTGRVPAVAKAGAA